MTEQSTGFGDSPEGWVRTTLGEIGDYTNGRAFKPSEWEESGRPILRIQNLTGSTKTVNRYSRPIEEQYIVRDGDFLISWSATLGAYIYRGEEAVLNQHIFRVQAYVDKLFLYYLVNAFIERLKSQIHGTGMQHITRGKFDSYPVPLPPLAEQHRIVAKIDELLTRLGAGVESLTKIKAQLKRYRQAVLTQAFEGKLTAEWRQAQKHELEPASVLLERIRQGRQKSMKGTFKGQPPLNTSGFSELPEGWMWARIGDICETTSGGTPSRRETTYYGGHIPWLKSGELDDHVIESAQESITEEGLKDSNAKIIPRGALLVALYGATAGRLGILAVDAAVNQAICAIFAPVQLDNKLLFWYLIKYRNELLAARRGGAQPNISQGIVNNIALPLSPILEQKQIVSEIERRFSVADQIEKTVDQGLKQAERLRQSILKRAFEGKLVPQDPNDEPAEKLVERIRDERARMQSGARFRNVAGKKTTTQEMRLR